MPSFMGHFTIVRGRECGRGPMEFDVHLTSL